MSYKNSKILVVDDEEDVTDLISYHLESEGLTVKTINDPSLIIGIGRDFQPDLFLLDIMMPGIDGIQICRMIRADSKLKDVPVVFLTAKSEDEDKILGWETGADDYICKPFNVKELVLRIKAILKRYNKRHSEPSSNALKIRGVHLDEDQFLLEVDGERVELTATEFKLLKLLIERKGKVQTRENLLISVWKYESDTETRTVDTHIRRLREKLGNQSGIIETIRGVGYKVVES